MKPDSPCPKCGAAQFLRIPGTFYDRIPVGFTMIGAVQVTQFVCRQCGFVERWVESAADRERLARRYPSSRSG